MTIRTPVPVIDLFAGPGGLGEGFSSIVDENGERRFSLRVSIEKDPIAHRTLSLRALFRALPKDHPPDCYYDYLRGGEGISRDALFSHPSVPEEARLAAAEAKHAELGKTDPDEIDKWIEEALRGADEWALIGGPPCQAYSIAGRSRRSKEATDVFESDEKHLLYREYLRIIQKFRPSVFVMENVKGILTSTHGGSGIFGRILTDLSSPLDDLEYRIRSFVVPGQGSGIKPNDFIIQSECFGLPQRRHRVILFGIRSDLADTNTALTCFPEQFVLNPSTNTVSVAEALSELPPLRSRLTRQVDTHDAWLSALKRAEREFNSWQKGRGTEIGMAMGRACREAEHHASYGGSFRRCEVTMMPSTPPELRSWLLDPRLGGVIQHETRAHMESDLHRYLFASCFAQVRRYSPKLGDFPPAFLPNHDNVVAESIPFADRFRVQMAGEPSSTVVAHIAKDGHYYIHPDPSQCRSLTVREAARLQTFPDNYFFEGSRTEQYAQIGNAVPPWLARQIAEVVIRFLDAARRPESPRWVRPLVSTQ